jgi:cobaltochelatase CobN
MHRLAATPGGWTPDSDGVIFIEQSPAPIVVLTAADTDLQCLAQVMALPGELPPVRGVNLLQLQQQLTIDTYAEDVLAHARIILVRLLGGRAYWSYGLEVVRAVVAETGAALVVLPGDDRPDPQLISLSTVPLTVANTVWRYWTEGGPDNLRHGLMALCDRLLDTAFQPPPPQPVPRVGRYQPPAPASALDSASPDQGELGTVGILFYRAHYLAGNTAPIDALMAAVGEGAWGAVTRPGTLRPVAFYVSSLQDLEVQQALLAEIEAVGGVDVLLNTTSFAVAKLDGSAPRLDLWGRLDVPVLQVILSGGTLAAWQQHPMGLMPRDIAMNVALPEVDGRIITRAVSFKASQRRSDALEMEVVSYEPVGDRVQFVAELAARWVDLRRTPVAQRRVALVLANYPNRDGRLANGVGLDTPQSCGEILRAMAAAGYTVADIPADGDALMQALTTGRTNDPDGQSLRRVYQTLSLTDYRAWYDQLPETVCTAVEQRWGTPEAELAHYWADYPALTTAHPQTSNRPKLDDSEHQAPGFPIAGLQLGQVFVGIQPSRGYDRDPSLNYHAPDLEPTHAYLAFYLWLRQGFQAQAIVHGGKHGNLEWLPGKGIGLSATCYPELALGPLPHFYPFIVNDPGEGAQAKRRAQAVILDHLTPPLTRAELYGPLQKLEGLVDEYYEAQSLDPTRLSVIRDRLVALLADTHLLEDLALGRDPVSVADNGGGGLQSAQDRDDSFPSPLVGRGKELDLPTLLPQLDGYLCDLKEAQIRDGLHIFGQCPQGRQLRDLLVAIARHPSGDRIGLTRAIAQDLQWEFDPLTANPADPFPPSPQLPELNRCRTIGDGVEWLEEQAAIAVATLLPDPPSTSSHAQVGAVGAQGLMPPDLASVSNETTHPLPESCHSPAALTPASASEPTDALHPKLTAPVSATARELAWIADTLLPALCRTEEEITHLLKGLDGRYVPSGPAGAPTRNRPDVLPTGRNFYSVDIRAIPTESAWDVGRKAAEVLVERYTQENGEYPTTLGLSMWGTATMRTGGDDLAEALALLGVRPVWDGPSRRVVDFEILPLSLLGRPRVDVTLRISGFFRDAFPNLIDLFNRAVAAVAALPEIPGDNPLAAQVQRETAQWQAAGLASEAAAQRSRYRVFGSKPGAYGAGLQGLIEAQNWQDDGDLARAYINWSSTAYGAHGATAAAPEAFSARLAQMQVVLHNQDNREHDLLDSDDYYQFQGGLTAAVRTVSGQQPVTYFGDNSQIAAPKVRSLREEISRVYRSRVVNPKWIAGVMRHGYKGAFEMAATVDYLFAYDATARCVADHMYTGIAQAYVLDETVQAFVRQSNPWALRDMAERLLEARQRGLWQGADTAMVDQLRAIAHAAEADIESTHNG